jgi:hypothetical protein
MARLSKWLEFDRAVRLIAERRHCMPFEAAEELVEAIRGGEVRARDSRTLGPAPNDWSWFGPILGTGVFLDILVCRADIDECWPEIGLDASTGEIMAASATLPIAILTRPDVAPIPNKPGGGGLKTARSIAAMIEAVHQNKISFDKLRRMKQKELCCLYPYAGRTTLAAARKEALKQLANVPDPDKALA